MASAFDAEAYIPGKKGEMTTLISPQLALDQSGRLKLVS